LLLLTLLVTPVAYSLWDDESRLWFLLIGWRKSITPDQTPSASSTAEAPKTGTIVFDGETLVEISTPHATHATFSHDSALSPPRRD